MFSETAFLWLGSYQSDTIFQQMPAKGIGQASAFASQKGLVKGLDAVLPSDCVLDTIGVVGYPPYPTYPHKWAKRIEWSRTGSSRDVNIGFLTVKYLSYASRDIELAKEVKAWAKHRAAYQHQVVMIYEPSVAKLKAALYLKEKHGAKVFVIIPDIPKLVNPTAHAMVKWGKALAEKKQRALFTKVDGFILYSAHMATYYGLADDKWVLMEGVFDPEEAERLSAEEPENSRHIRMMYCGVLEEARGTIKLLDCFTRIDNPDYELWLTGGGKAESLVKERAAKDPRIKFFGYLDSREEVLRLEHQADVLIHTRDTNAPAAPYCFPSKLFEYFATGKPVISVDIPGIPREYFQYMIKIDPFTVEGICNAINEAVSMDAEQRKALGEKARKFVLEEKNSRVQAGKMLDFISRNMQKR